jgi:hypothetical protein
MTHNGTCGDRTTDVAQRGDGLLIHWLYENTKVLSRRDSPDGHVEFDVRVPRERIGELNRHWRRATH